MRKYNWRLGTLEELKKFCPLCYEIEVANREKLKLLREAERRAMERYGERKDAPLEAIMAEIDSNAQIIVAKPGRLLSNHPRCGRCKVLFEKKHLAKKGKNGLCKVCEGELQPERG